MEKTIAFWRDLLGLNLAITYSDRDGRQYAFTLPGGGLIYFFEWKNVTAPSPKHPGKPVQGPFHFDHLALCLNSRKELYRLQDQLVECDLPVSDVIDHGYIYSIYTYDPNGIPLEFNYQPEALDFFYHPVLGDKNPTGSVREGTEPVPGKWPEAELDDTTRIVIEGADRQIFKK